MLEGSGAVMHCTTFLFMLMMSCAPAAVAASLAAAKVPDAQCVLLEPLSLQEHVSPLAMIMSVLPLGGWLLLCARATRSAHWISISFVLWTALTAVMIACALGIAVLTAWSDTIQSWVLVASTALPHALSVSLMSPLGPHTPSAARLKDLHCFGSSSIGLASLGTEPIVAASASTPHQQLSSVYT